MYLKGERDARKYFIIFCSRCWLSCHSAIPFLIWGTFQYQIMKYLPPQNNYARSLTGFSLSNRMYLQCSRETWRENIDWTSCTSMFMLCLWFQKLHIICIDRFIGSIVPIIDTRTRIKLKHCLCTTVLGLKETMFDEDQWVCLGGMLFYRGTPVFNNFTGFVFTDVAYVGIKSDPDAKRV